MSIPQESKLLPCPFCGGESKLINMGADRYHIECSSCKAIVGSVWGNKEIPEELAELWNTRPLEAALRSRIARLEAAGDAMYEKRAKFDARVDRVLCAFCDELLYKKEHWEGCPGVEWQKAKTTNESGG